MPFVERNSEGRIVGVHRLQTAQGLEEVPAHDPGLRQYLHEQFVDGLAREKWRESDLAVARVCEDMMRVLVARGLFNFTDLPSEAQEKILERDAWRRQFRYMESLVNGTSDGFAPRAEDDPDANLV